ncbi:protein FAM169B isoform X2 [Trichomycterus rosablanca]|uniref:protein FAM169B isoform X2 n=1 Tax=Trichomycterus rosablanca TaxID=2290929 RepID=UPI002F3596BD
METDSDLLLTNKGNLYPVDLPSQNYDELRPDSEYLSSLETDTKSFSLPNGAEMKITHNNIGQLRLFGKDDPAHFLLALHTPEDETQVVALYVHGKFWPVSDVLKTSRKSRNGLVFVESVMERVILFLLSQIVFGVLERPLEEDVYFSVHPMSEYGSLCNGNPGQFYLLPVLDTVFVRTRWRRKGLALKMLQDFCFSMPTESVLGISYPISPSMYRVCQKYLEMQPEQREHLYEVEAPGDWSQRRNVWLSIQLQQRLTHSKISDERLHNTEPTEGQLTDTKGKGAMLQDSDSVTSPKQCSDHKNRVKRRQCNYTETPDKCKNAKMF